MTFATTSPETRFFVLEGAASIIHHLMVRNRKGEDSYLPSWSKPQQTKSNRSFITNITNTKPR